MEQFVKLTKIVNFVIEDKKRTVGKTNAVYVRPWDIESFSQDEDGLTSVKFNNNECIHVTETPEQIYKMVSEEKKWQDKIQYTPFENPVVINPYPIYYEHTPSWWDAPWWKNPTITCNTTTIPEGTVHAWNTSDTADLLFRVTPNYASAIIVGNGDIWE